MSIGTKLAKLLTNKYLLYFVVFLSAINILGYIVLHKLNAVIFFSLIGLISYQFSKNMTVVLLISLLMTNLFAVSKSTIEGLQNKKEGAEVMDKANKANDKKTNSPKKEADDDSPPEAYDGGKKGSKKGGARIDYMSTLEGAYDNLDKMLGSDGIKSLTNDTKTLMEQQQKLFDTMQNMTPMLEQAKSMISGFDPKSLQGLSELASSFSSSGLAESGLVENK
jgi:hypothetical protein